MDFIIILYNMYHLFYNINNYNGIYKLYTSSCVFSPRHSRSELRSALLA